MALTLSAADAALKEFYEDGIREQLNNDIPMLAQFEKNTRDIVGRRAILALHVQRNPSAGSRLDGSNLPGFNGGIGNQGYVDAQVPLKYHYGMLQLTGPTIEAMKSDRGSFVRAVESETAGITNDLKRDLNRQVWGTSDGVIAATAANASATNAIVTTGTAVQMAQIEVGMVIDIGDTAASPAMVATGVTVTAVSGQTVTISGSAITTTTGHRIYRNGSGGSGASQAELTGIQTQVANGNNLFAVNATTYPIWNSTVTASVGSLSESTVAKTMQTIQRSSGLYPNLGVASDGVFRSYGNLLTSLKRFQNTVDLKGGYKGLDFTAGGPTIPIVWDRDCPNQSLYLLNTDHFKEYQYADWQWMNRDGAVLARSLVQDKYQATLFKYFDIATDQRNAHGVLQGITEA